MAVPRARSTGMERIERPSKEEEKRDADGAPPVLKTGVVYLVLTLVAGAVPAIAEAAGHAFPEVVAVEHDHTGFVAVAMAAAVIWARIKAPSRPAPGAR